MHGQGIANHIASYSGGINIIAIWIFNHFCKSGSTQPLIDITYVACMKAIILARERLLCIKKIYKVANSILILITKKFVTT